MQRAAINPNPIQLSSHRTCRIARALLREARDYTDQHRLNRTNSPLALSCGLKEPHLQLLLGISSRSEHRQRPVLDLLLFDHKKALLEIFCWTRDGLF